MFNMPLSKRVRTYLVVGLTACLVLPGIASPAGDKGRKAKRIREFKEYPIRWREDFSGIGEAKIPVRKGAPLYTVYIYDTLGMHCCETVVIHDSKNGKTVYDSELYGLDGRVTLIDLDGNGTAEIIQNITSFHEYDGMSIMSSPWVNAIFTYEVKLSRYVLANSRFPEFWQDTLKEARSKRPSAHPVPAMPSEGGIDLDAIWKIEGPAVAKAVNLILAGYEKEAYAWLERQYEDPEDGRRAVKTLREHMRHEELLLQKRKCR